VPRSFSPAIASAATIAAPLSSRSVSTGVNSKPSSARPRSAAVLVSCTSSGTTAAMETGKPRRAAFRSWSESRWTSRTPYSARIASSDRSRSLRKVSTTAGTTLVSCMATDASTSTSPERSAAADAAMALAAKRSPFGPAVRRAASINVRAESPPAASTPYVNVPDDRSSILLRCIAVVANRTSGNRRRGRTIETVTVRRSRSSERISAASSGASDCLTCPPPPVQRSRQPVRRSGRRCPRGSGGRCWRADLRAYRRRGSGHGAGSRCGRTASPPRS